LGSIRVVFKRALRSVRPSPSLAWSQSEIASASVEDDRLVVDEVVDFDGVGDVVGRGPVAAIGDGPNRSQDGVGDGAGAAEDVKRSKPPPFPSA
jgi:hypothetical protein